MTQPDEVRYTPASGMPQIWSIYDRENRLVLGLSDEPGIFNFARPPDDDVEPFECHYATLQCYDIKAEPELMTLIDGCDSLEEFLESLISKGYNVTEGHPQPGKFARL